MPGKNANGSKHGATRSKRCILEADESKLLCMEGIVPQIHEDHIAGKVSNSLHHYNLVHKFIPMPQAMKIPAAE